MKLITVCMLVSIAPYVYAFKLGVENIAPATISALRGKRIGLITNQTGKDQQGRSTAHLLLTHGLNVVTLFSPEHGFTGTTGAEKNVYDTVDPLTNIRVLSLYSNTTGKKIAPEQFNTLDVLVFDMQDSGMRHYTYISTLLHCLESAAAHRKPFFVLDRPNPLSWNMEGPLVDEEVKSFVSIAPIPLRHGMTMGEIARYFNSHVLKSPASLTVVTMDQYQRNEGLFCPANQMLSPNIANQQSCYGYCFLGLLGEVKPINVGVGTDKSFQCITLPASIACSHAQWQKLQTILQQHNMPSTPYEYFDAHKKQTFVGLQLNFDAIAHIPSFKALIAVLTFFADLGITLEYSSLFDKAVGTRAVQKALKGNGSFATLTHTINKELHTFFDTAHASKIFLYEPHPRIIELQ
jgi:uncharacterized protein YbbC (DUF1343 family)